MNWPVLVGMLILIGVAAFVAYTVYVGTKEERKRLKKPPCPTCGGSGFDETDERAPAS